MNQKTLADVLDILLARKSAFDVDTTVKLVVGGTEMGSLEVKGRICYIPSEEEK
jgi:hypothetical protein